MQDGGQPKLTGFLLAGGFELPARAFLGGLHHVYERAA